MTANARFVVKVPATTANLGPGFDCLGMALDIWNTVEIEVGASGVEISGEGSDVLSTDSSNLIIRSFQRACSESGRKAPSVRVVSKNQVPVGRGLGSSTTAVVAGLTAGNEACGRPLSQERLLEIATEIEGHPDNAAAAFLGGCQIVVREEGRWVTVGLPIPDGLRAVIFIPSIPAPTAQARELLSSKIERRDAVYNIGRVALLTRAFSTGDFEHLAIATGDRLHQPARQVLFPSMSNIFRAALSAGALGVFLSGAGSSIVALTRGRELTIGYEMADAAAKSNVAGDIKVANPTTRGVHLV